MTKKAKEYYFSHDLTARNDLKIVAMRSAYGMEGYGLYWVIVEMMHSTEEGKLQNKDYIFIAIAKQTEAFAKQNEANYELVKKYVQDCIDVYELFSSDGEYFWCDRVLRNMKRMAEISATRREAGSLGGSAKQTKAIAKQNVANRSKRNDTNVSKKEINIAFDAFWDLYGKKVGSKSKTTIMWEKLSDDERSIIIEKIPAYLSTLNPDDHGKWQVYPSTYLNERRWENELDSKIITPSFEPEKPRRFLNDPNLIK